MDYAKLNLKNIPVFFCYFIFIVLGIFLRAKVYLLGLSIWGDEFTTILKENIITLLFSTPSHIPGGLAAASKLLCNMFGFTEYTVRFIPFVFSILSIFAFLKLSKICFNTHSSRILALFLFATHEYLIFEGAFYKQYSLELFITIVALYFALKININELKKSQLIIISLISACLFWFSFTYVFVIGAIFLVVFLKCLLQKDILNLKRVFVFGIINITALFCNVFLNLKPFLTNKALHDSFVSGASTFFPSFSGFVDLFNFYFYNHIGLPLDFVINLTIILVILGCIVFAIQNRFMFFVLMSPVLVTLLASLLNMYPFQERLTMFLYPVLLLLVLKPLDFAFSLKFTKKINIVILLLIISLYGFIFHYILLNRKYVLNQILNNDNYFRYSTSKEFYQILKGRKLEPNAKIYNLGRDSSLFFYSGIQNNVPYEDLMAFVEDNYPVCDYDCQGAFYEPELQKEIKNPVGKIHRGFIKGHIWYIYLMDYDFVHKCYLPIKTYIESNYKILEKKEFKNGATFIKFET